MVEPEKKVMKVKAEVMDINKEVTVVTEVNCKVLRVGEQRGGCGG